MGLATILAYYWVASRLWGNKEGLIAAWASAAVYSIVSWNVMYTPLLSIIIFYLGNRLLEGKKYFWLAIALAIFAGTTHLVPASLLIMILTIYFLIKNKPPVKNILFGFLFGLIWLTPLILFDLRHDFLIFHKIVEFLTAQGSHSGIINLLAFRGYYRGLTVMGGDGLNIYWYIFERIFLALTIVSGIALTKEKSKRIWYALWFIFPLVVLLFYWRNIPEYYFGVPFALLPLFLAFIVKKFKYAVVLFLIVGSVIQINHVLREEIQVSINDKKNIASFMTNYAKDRHFNFSYEVPLGEETGYGFIFSWLKHEPENIPEGRLYTLTRSPKDTENVIYSNKGLFIIER